MLPDASTPMMPALAEDSTASMKRRRLSISSEALTSSSRWLRSSCVILLKVSPSWARSPSDFSTGTWTLRSPVETMLAALIRRRIGATRRLAKLRPISTEAIRMVSAITANISANATWMPSLRDSSCGVFGDAGLGLAQLRHHARIEHARDVEEGVGEAAQPDHGGDVIGLDEDGDLRLVIVDALEEVRLRRRECLLNAGLRALQDVAILVDHHRARQVARGGARGEHLAEARGVELEQRTRVRDVVGHARECRRGSAGHAHADRRWPRSASSGSPPGSGPRTAGRGRGRW